MSLIYFALGLVMLVVAYRILKEAERRLERARDFYRDADDALQEAKRINAESASLLNGQAVASDNLPPHLRGLL